MRRLVLFLLLLGTVTAAGIWHRERFLLRDPDDPAERPGPDDRLVLRVGGGDPLPAVPPRPRSTTPTPRLLAGPEPEAPPPSPTHVVRSGETLSEIVQRVYGSARPTLVQAVANHNGLRDPDRITPGTVLSLPSDLSRTP